MPKDNEKKQMNKSAKKAVGTHARKPQGVAKNSKAKGNLSTRNNNNKKSAKNAVNTKQKQKSNTQKMPTNRRSKATVKIIPLGGLNEIGKNFTVFECQNDMFIVDCGLAFPEADMPGVDLVIPDFTYVERNAEKLKGVVLTHGHEDHIGGLPYFLKKFNVPVYGTRLTIGLVEGKLKEHGIHANLNVVTYGQVVHLGCMAAEFVAVNHSIPDAAGLAIHTPSGIIVHTGDFKIDTTPINGQVIDLARFGELGKKGVLLLMTDSTNAERPGYTMTEASVGAAFDKLFDSAGNRRIIVATFASNVHRIQQVIQRAVAQGRKVAVSGRSMQNVVHMATELGYLKVPENTLIDISEISKYSDNELVIITTGSQGEPMSALTRMSTNDHRQVSITANDLIIISANPIPGNEKFVGKVVNELLKSGAEVIYEAMYEVHVSGHACREEIKIMLALTKPKFYMPVHGEYKHLVKNKELGMAMGIPEENIVISNIGQVIEVNRDKIAMTGVVPSGRVLIDGLGVGDVGSVVLRDRKLLSEDGLVIAAVTLDKVTKNIVAGPEVVSRGFVYVKESEELMNSAREALKLALVRCSYSGITEYGIMRQKMKDAVSDYIYTKTKRRPMILPVIMEV